MLTGSVFPLVMFMFDVICVFIKAMLMILSQDGGMRVLVAGGWSGHNIRTAEVKTELCGETIAGVQPCNREVEGGR